MRVMGGLAEYEPSGMVVVESTRGDQFHVVFNVKINRLPLHPPCLLNQEFSFDIGTALFSIIVLKVPGSVVPD